MNSKSSQSVMTIIGPDKPGIVDSLSGILSREGFNIEDSRMAVLGGEFAMILLVSGAGPVDPWIAEMEKKSGMAITCRNAATSQQRPEGIPFMVYGYAMDHPGIVHAIAREVASFGANIEEMETSTNPAPVTGSPLFDVTMRVSLPPDVPVNRLRERLKSVGEERNIDVVVEPFSR